MLWLAAPKALQYQLHAWILFGCFHISFALTILLCLHIGILSNFRYSEGIIPLPKFINI